MLVHRGGGGGTVFLHHKPDTCSSHEHVTATSQALLSPVASITLLSARPHSCIFTQSFHHGWRKPKTKTRFVFLFFSDQKNYGSDEDKIESSSRRHLLRQHTFHNGYEIWIELQEKSENLSVLQPNWLTKHPLHSHTHGHTHTSHLFTPPPPRSNTKNSYWYGYRE